GRLVTVSGALLDVAESEDEIRLFLSSEGSMVAAVGERALLESQMPSLAIGATLALTGVYHIVYDEHAQPDEASILIRQASDIEIVKPAPWWTPRKGLFALAVCLAAACGGGLWTLL